MINKPTITIIPIPIKWYLKKIGFQIKLSNHCKMNHPVICFLISILDHMADMKKAKQIMMVVHANPNTHPGGVQGALLRSEYQAELTPSEVNMPPNAKPAKLMIRNKTNLM